MINPFYVVKDGKYIKYNRIGECNKCGDCCGTKNTITYALTTTLGRAISAPAEMTAAEMLPWEGYTTFQAQGIWWWFKVLKTELQIEEEACNAQDKETMLCKGWKDVIEFPAICSYWPFKTSDLELFPRCGFSFIKVIEEEQDGIMLAGDSQMDTLEGT